MVASKIQVWVTRAGVAGVILFEAGFALTQLQFRGVTAAQWHRLCQSGLIQLSRLSSLNAIGDCRLAAAADYATGWLIGTGIALIGGSLISIIARRAGILASCHFGKLARYAREVNRSKLRRV